MPQLHDDGTTVTLDLHGTRVDEALALARRTVAAATRRGRTTVKLIHGSSSSSQLYANRSIKHALHRLLDDDGFDAFITSEWRAEGHLLLSLDLTTRPDPNRLQFRDVRR